MRAGIFLLAESFDGVNFSCLSLLLCFVFLQLYMLYERSSFSIK